MLKKDLGSDGAPMLEQLLIQHAALCWLRVTIDFPIETLLFIPSFQTFLHGLKSHLDANATPASPETNSSSDKIEFLLLGKVSTTDSG